MRSATVLAVGVAASRVDTWEISSQMTKVPGASGRVARSRRTRAMVVASSCVKPLTRARVGAT